MESKNKTVLPERVQMQCSDCLTVGDMASKEAEGLDYRLEYHKFRNEWVWMPGEWYCPACSELIEWEAW